MLNKILSFKRFKLKHLKWAVARILFYIYVSFIIFTGIFGAVLTSPIGAYYMLGDWKKFWKHKNLVFPLLIHTYKMFFLVLKENHNFMFSVPLSSTPLTKPDLNIVNFNPNWQSGCSCRPCNHNCCNNCPLINKKTGTCLSYNSFFWNYFNCGRFPSSQSEIDYYKCPKWKFI